jgi:hypothetical protein
LIKNTNIVEKKEIDLSDNKLFSGPSKAGMQSQKQGN